MSTEARKITGSWTYLAGPIRKPDATTSLPGEQTFQCGTGEPGTLRWSKPLQTDQYFSGLWKQRCTPITDLKPGTYGCTVKANGKAWTFTRFDTEAERDAFTRGWNDERDWQELVAASLKRMLDRTFPAVPAGWPKWAGYPTTETDRENR